MHENTSGRIVLFDSLFNRVQYKLFIDSKLIQMMNFPFF